MLKKLKLNYSMKYLEDFLELTPKKDVLFILGDCNAQVWKDTWSNRQVWPWGTEWSRAKANRVLPREFMVIANTLFQQHKRWLYIRALPDGQCRNQIDYILCRRRWRNSIQSAKTRLWADCSSDHELLIDKFRLKLKKVGKTTRPFRYDLNQVPYDYTVDVTNRFKGPSIKVW